MSPQEDKDLNSKKRVFIKYLNLPIRSDPSLIKTIFDEIKYALIDKEDSFLGVYDGAEEYPQVFSAPNLFDLPEDLTSILSLIDEYSTIDEERAYERMRKYTTQDYCIREQEKIAYRAIYRYSFDGCKKCPFNDEEQRTILFKDYKFPGSCLGCDQLFVNETVEELVNGVDPSEAFGLDYLANIFNRYPPTLYIKPYSLKEERIFNPSPQFEIYNSKLPENRLSKLPENRLSNWLNELLLSFIANDLFDYLFEKGAGNLKRCKYCNQYFDALNKSAKICYSEDCDRMHNTLKQRKKRGSDKI